jgi:lipoyl(octanoyl) transferase
MTTPYRGRQDLERCLEWRVDDAPIPYLEAVAEMERRVDRIAAGTSPELVWLLEHPALYTAGTSARPEHLLDPGRLPVFRSGRGGQYTYHGPGQRVGYVLLDLRYRERADLRLFVHGLEEWMIRTLARFAIRGERRPAGVGVWVQRSPGREEKIAAIGVRVRRWVTFHGAALNVDPDLGHFSGILPCGIAEHGVTSLAALGLHPSMPEVDMALKAAFAEVFAAPPGTEI